MLISSAMSHVLKELPEDPVDALIRALSVGRARPSDGLKRSLAAAEQRVETAEKRTRVAEERADKAEAAARLSDELKRSLAAAEQRVEAAEKRARAAEERADKAEAANDEYRAAAAAYRWRLAAAVGASSAKPASSGSSALAVWAPFEALLSLQSAAQSDAGGGDKLVMPAKHFLFGQTKAFMDGLPGMLEGGLVRSMAEEARENEGGKWWAEFRYVVERAAEEDVADLPSTAKFKGHTIAGHTIVRDHGHAGMSLANFCEHEMARSAGLSVAEVAAIRLYSGPMYAPINYALRTEQINDWATTIGCCYSGVLKLSFCSQPARVYRGVREDEMRLPDEFLSREEGKFAGGVERAFMSTTKSPAVALDYSGGAATIGSIFVIDFDMNSRGASIQWLSQYPHEEELLFPPCTGLACLDVEQHSAKRCVRVSAQVSTARLDTRELVTPTSVPGTRTALRFVAQLLGKSETETASMKAWDLHGQNLSEPERVARVGVLLRAYNQLAVERLDLRECRIDGNGAEVIAKGLRPNTLLMEVC